MWIKSAESRLHADIVFLHKCCIGCLYVVTWNIVDDFDKVVVVGGVLLGVGLHKLIEVLIWEMLDDHSNSSAQVFII